MKKKSKKRSKKKSRKGKVLFLLIMLGIGLGILALFHQEILNSIKPVVKRPSIPEEKKEVLVYFSDGEGEYLVGEKREILRKGDVKEEAKETINELIKGPKRRLIPTLPSSTKLLSIQLSEDGVAKINFNKNLSQDHPGGSSAEMMTLYSIVNSLTHNFPEIKRVQILIEGKPVETIAGHLSLRKPVSPNPDLIKGMVRKK